MFQPKSFFIAGLKILGVLTIVWSFVQIAPVVLQFYYVYNQPDMMPANDLSNYRLSLIFQVVYPIVLVSIGVYLLKSGEALIQFAFRGWDEKNEEGIGQLFRLFMKLAGLVLIIYSIPTAFQLLSNVLFISSAKIIGTSNQMNYIVQNLVSTVVNLLLGLYLLRSGNIFYKIGFNNTKETD
ncbi:hypothetical protein ACFSFY_15980 [Sporosarcina siberiensis]|uniref:DUF2975 domain-containing protein n=1 Tax=Sporosarcina siberiensis TaxID=1365606 RepID=A0ABW4SIZ9_9BACL